MKWLARRDVGSARSSHSEDRWFAWYPVVIATSKFSAQWVWLEFVERKWSAGIYGTGRKKRRYRLPKKEARQSSFVLALILSPWDSSRATIDLVEM